MALLKSSIPVLLFMYEVISMYNALSKSGSKFYSNNMAICLKDNVY